MHSKSYVISDLTDLSSKVPSVESDAPHWLASFLTRALHIRLQVLSVAPHTKVHTHCRQGLWKKRKRNLKLRQKKGPSLKISKLLRTPVYICK